MIKEQLKKECRKKFTNNFTNNNEFIEQIIIFDKFWEWIETKVSRVELPVSPIFTEEEHKILKLLLASKIAEIQVHIVYDEPAEQRMGKVKLINILNDIHKKISK